MANLAKEERRKKRKENGEHFRTYSHRSTAKTHRFEEGKEVVATHARKEAFETRRINAASNKKETGEAQVICMFSHAGLEEGEGGG